MATRSYIGMKNDDGSVDVIYCHWDGYPEHNGRILREHYSTKEALSKLIKLGNISVLAPSTDCPEGHMFETPVEGHCIAYGRDRGEKEQEADHLICEAEFALTKHEEYNYLFKDGEWWVRKGRNPNPLSLLV